VQYRAQQLCTVRCTHIQTDLTVLWLTLQSVNMPTNKIWMWTESTPRCGWGCSHMAGIYKSESREMNCSSFDPMVILMSPVINAALVMSPTQWAAPASDCELCSLSLSVISLVIITDCLLRAPFHCQWPAFPVATRTWNSLSQHITSAPSLPVFRARLKTYLFHCPSRDCKMPTWWLLSFWTFDRSFIAV